MGKVRQGRERGKVGGFEDEGRLKENIWREGGSDEWGGEGEKEWRSMDGRRKEGRGVREGGGGNKIIGFGDGEENQKVEKKKKKQSF